MMLLESSFVGSGRSDLISALESIYATVTKHSEPRWVSITAPTGWGKTRIVREFYRRVAAVQPSPAYWPSDLLIPRADTPHGVERKRVARSFQHEPTSELTYLWWGIQCGGSVDEPLAAIRNAAGQLEAHSDHIERSWSQRASVSQRAARTFEGVRAEAAMEGGTEFASAAAQAALGIEPVGLGLTWWLGKRLLAAGSRRRRLDQAHISDDQISDDGNLLLQECVALFRRLGSVGIPLILVLEDAHLVDEGTAKLLHELMPQPLPILIVTTKVPEVSNAGLEQALASRDDRVVKWTAGPEPRQPQPHDRVIQPLSFEDLGSIVADWFPAVDQRTKRSLANRYSNPLALELFCSLPRNESLRRGAAASLSEDEIRKLPNSVRDMYRAVWETIDAEARTALHIAARLSPYGLHPDFGRDRSWDVDLVRDAVRMSGIKNAPAIAARLQYPSESWSALEKGRSRMIEVDQFQIAFEDDDLLEDSALDELFASLELRLLERRPDGEFFIDAEVWSWARTSLALEAGHATAHPEVLGLGGLIVVAELTRFDQSPDEALRISSHLLDVMRLAPSILVSTQHLHARALISVGKLKEAARILQELSVQIAGDESRPDSFLFQVRIDLAIARIEVGDLPRAIADLEALLESGVEDEHEVSERLLWSARVNLAHGLRSNGDTNEALKHLEELKAELAEVVDLDPAIYASVWGNLAEARFESGAHADALKAWAEVIATLSARVGYDSPLTLVQRSNLASAKSTMGPAAAKESVAELRRVLDPRSAALGTRHPAVLSTRANLADALHEAGDDGAALLEYEAVVQDSISVLGIDHPVVLSRRNNLALSYQENRRLGLAISEMQSVLLDLERVLGKTHPYTRGTRKSLRAMLELRQELRKSGLTAFGTKRAVD